MESRERDPEISSTLTSEPQKKKGRRGKRGQRAPQLRGAWKTPCGSGEVPGMLGQEGVTSEDEEPQGVSEKAAKPSEECLDHGEPGKFKLCIGVVSETCTPGNCTSSTEFFNLDDQGEAVTLASELSAPNRWVRRVMGVSREVSCANRTGRSSASNPGLPRDSPSPKPSRRAHSQPKARGEETPDGDSGEKCTVES